MVSTQIIRRRIRSVQDTAKTRRSPSQRDPDRDRSRGAARARERAVQRYAEIVPGPEARTLLHFAGNEAAAVEGVHGAGKYMLYAFDAGTDGSELALSPMFLPLLHRTVVYLAGETGRQKLQYDVGERLELLVPIAQDARRAGGADTTAGGGANTFSVTTPSGQREVVEARFVGKMALVAYENTEEPGHYVFQGMGGEFVRAVNVATSESDRHELEAPRSGGTARPRSQPAARPGAVGPAHSRGPPWQGALQDHRRVRPAGH